jgi:hypothetical protein
VQRVVGHARHPVSARRSPACTPSRTADRRQLPADTGSGCRPDVRCRPALGWFRALNAAVTEIATTGLDQSIGRASGPVRAYAVPVLFAAAGLLAAGYALFTDTPVPVRLSQALGGALGGVPRRMRDQVIVCGLGAVGLGSPSGFPRTVCR